MAPVEEQAVPLPHIALLPSPGIGHLIPLAELAKQLVHHHNLAVTIIVPSLRSPHQAQIQVLEALPRTVNFVLLPPVSLEDLPKDTQVGTRIVLTVARSLSSLRDTLNSFVVEKTRRLVAVVVDFFSTDAIDVAKEFKLKSFLFFPSPGMSLLFWLHWPKLDETVQGEFRDLLEPVQLPGCVPVHGKDLFLPAQNRSDSGYHVFLYLTKRFRLAEGILLNSFHDLEPGPIKALQFQVQADEPDWPPVYPVGPLIQTASFIGSDRPECLKWLDNQPSGSVLFVAFGSGGTLSHDQLIELAYGLEMSGQRFLWVVRDPDNKSSNAAFLGIHSQMDHCEFLPEGFLDRTKGKGLMVSYWAPQISILAHGSTGGFLTHCGWNSILESVVNGVPLIAWPLYAEQKMNAVMLTEDTKVALRAKVNDESGMVEREQIARVVKCLMEGEEGKILRSRMEILKEAAKEVMSKNGSTENSLSELVNMWKNLPST